MSNMTNEHNLIQFGFVKESDDVRLKQMIQNKNKFKEIHIDTYSENPFVSSSCKDKAVQLIPKPLGNTELAILTKLFIASPLLTFLALCTVFKICFCLQLPVSRAPF